MNLIINDGGDSSFYPTPNIQTSDLAQWPTDADSYPFGTSATPAAGASTVGLKNETVLTGILNPIISTADSIAKIWGSVEGTKIALQNSRFNADVAQSQFDLTKTVTLGNLDVAKAQAQSKISQGMAQAQQTAKSAQGAIMARGTDWQFIFGAAGFGLALYSFYKGKK